MISNMVKEDEDCSGCFNHWSCQETQEQLWENSVNWIDRKQERNNDSELSQMKKAKYIIIFKLQ